MDDEKKQNNTEQPAPQSQQQGQVTKTDSFRRAGRKISTAAGKLLHRLLSLTWKTIIITAIRPLFYLFYLVGHITLAVLAGLAIVNSNRVDWTSAYMIAGYISAGTIAGVVTLLAFLKVLSWKRISLALKALIFSLGITSPLLVIANRGKINWASDKMIALYILFGAVAAGMLAWVVRLKRVFRPRWKMEKILKDSNIQDWLIVFDWTPKTIYMPAIAASFLASVLMFLKEADWWIFGSISPAFIGGAWFVILILNLLVEEYDIDLRTLGLIILGCGCFLLWLHLLGWVTDFFRLLRRITLSMSADAYLLAGILGVLTVFISWVRGLFYYVAVTPNCLYLQQGPSETVFQIEKEGYDIEVETRSFLKRVMGMGRIKIIFKTGRGPLSYLVFFISEKEARLTGIRGVTVVTGKQPVPG